MPTVRTRVLTISYRHLLVVSGDTLPKYLCPVALYVTVLWCLPHVKAPTCIAIRHSAIWELQTSSGSRELTHALTTTLWSRAYSYSTPHMVYGETVAQDLAKQSRLANSIFTSYCP